MKIEWQVDWLEPEPGILTLLQTAADSALAAQGITVPCAISLRLTDDEVIHQINREYRNIDRATDILSFPMTGAKPSKLLHNDSPMLRRAYDPDEGCCYLGDLVMSMDHVKAQAEEYGSGLSREAAYLLVHGVCHLMGYDHMNDEDKKEMRRMEEKAMAMMGLSQDEEAKVTKEDLMALARAAMDRAYVPYSHFRVGAALLCKDGRVFQGCNIENSSYGATIAASVRRCSKRSVKAPASLRLSLWRLTIRRPGPAVSAGRCCPSSPPILRCTSPGTAAQILMRPVCRSFCPITLGRRIWM